MIIVTRLNESRFAINPDLIERLQASPDTTIVLVDGTTYVVRESLEHVIDMIAEYRAKVIALAYSAPVMGVRAVSNATLVALPSRDSRDARDAREHAIPIRDSLGSGA